MKIYLGTLERIKFLAIRLYGVCSTKNGVSVEQSRLNLGQIIVYTVQPNMAQTFVGPKL